MGPPSTGLVFTPQNGGLGALLTCTTTSSRVALPSPRDSAVFAVNNLDADTAFLAFGDSSITATTSYSAFQPGTTYIGIPNARGSGAPTYVAGIILAGADTTRVQITAGSFQEPG